MTARTPYHIADNATSKHFVSFDGCISLSGKVLRPDRYDFFSAASDFSAARISRGAGLSYAAASFGEGVVTIEHGQFDRIISFDQDARLIEVEAGMTLGQLYDFLIERGLLLATQPGHPGISIGGCIGADIHGKNQFLDGTFINQVAELTLYHPSHGVLKVSPTDEGELFRLTCGGYGLTGNILSAKLKLKEIVFPEAQVTFKPIEGVADLISGLKQAAGEYDILFSWHDFTDLGKGFGRGFIQAGRFGVGEAERNTNAASNTMADSGGQSTGRGRKSLVLGSRKAAEQTLSAESRGDLKISVFNAWSVRLMNLLYGARSQKGESTISLSLFDSMFPIQHSKELYFKFFGQAGFHEYQVILPEDRLAEYVDGVKQFLQKKPLPITLASAKLFSGKNDLLRFTGQGICFALNFPQQKEAGEFLTYLDSLLIKCGGIPNIIKDSRLSRSVVEACYPEYDKFKRLVREFDPQRIYRSELSERLDLL